VPVEIFSHAESTGDVQKKQARSYELIFLAILSYYHGTIMVFFEHHWLIVL